MPGCVWPVARNTRVQRSAPWMDWKDALMTERRPHWDDDLVNAVIDLQYHCVDCMEDDYPEIDPINHDAATTAASTRAATGATGSAVTHE